MSTILIEGKDIYYLMKTWIEKLYMSVKQKIQKSQDMYIALLILLFFMGCYFYLHEEWLKDMTLLIMGVITGALRASLDPSHYGNYPISIEKKDQLDK